MRGVIGLQTLAAIGILCVSNLFAGESEYFRDFISLLDTNNSGPTLSKLSAERMRNSGEMAGVKLGMTMSEVVRAWGKPQCFYSNCEHGPRFDYRTANCFFNGDKLRKVWIRVSDSIVEADSGAVSMTDTEGRSECYLQFSKLIDTNNVGPLITNSLPVWREAPPGENVAGISLGMTMSEIVERWGRPRLLWGPSLGNIRFGYMGASLSFDQDLLKEIWIIPRPTNTH